MFSIINKISACAELYTTSYFIKICKGFSDAVEGNIAASDVGIPHTKASLKCDCCKL